MDSSFSLFSSELTVCLSSCISASFSFNSLDKPAISFLLWIEAMMFSLSLTVGRVEFPIAACSGFQASFSSRSNALLCPKSTNAACSSVLSSDIISSYILRNDGVILPMCRHLSIQQHHSPRFSHIHACRFWSLCILMLD
jgi:hypothetical protein